MTDDTPKWPAFKMEVTREGAITHPDDPTKSINLFQCNVVMVRATTTHNGRKARAICLGGEGSAQFSDKELFSSCRYTLRASLIALIAQGDLPRRENERARISRDELYLGMAGLLAQRSTCTRGHVGALIVVDKRPAGGGYNGAPSGLPECIEVGCDELTLCEVSYQDIEGTDIKERIQEPVELGCQRAVHAELNAIAWAARHGVATKGATMYCTHASCGPCAKAIVAAGFKRFVYKKSYRAERLDILLDGGLTVLWHEPSVPL